MKYLILLPLALDCLLNMLLGGSIRETLSSRAHRMRVKPQPYWWWLAGVIDGILFFDPDHCAQQFIRERRHGSAWRAWRAAP